MIQKYNQIEIQSDQEITGIKLVFVSTKNQENMLVKRMLFIKPNKI